LLEGCPIVTPRSERPSTTEHAAVGPEPRRGQPIVGVSWRLLIACAPFGARLGAAAAANAIARGIQDGGLPEPDVCALALGDREAEEGNHVRRVLDELGFDERMREARAVIIGVERLQERTLAGSVAFEIATRARQRGVPAYAVTAADALDRFDARILDLQLILQARSRAALVGAGLELAALV
jgi:glycerate kinase